MKTNLLYLTNSYLKETTTTIVEIIEGDQLSLILKDSIFYAQGGGQPADHGFIEGKNGTFEVTHVSYNDGALLHKGKLTGNIEVGETVTLKLDWPRRYHHMQLH